MCACVVLCVKRIYFLVLNNLSSLPLVVNLIRCTFTDPEVASVGMSETEFREKYPEGKGKIAYWHASKIDRAITDGEKEGYYKIFFSNDNKVEELHCIFNVVLMAVCLIIFVFVFVFVLTLFNY
eukprot:m.148741 g.148741  ORF g.148741 m.148741 type:complete len:124 (+) comp13262_c2_seq19:86-457(+)